MKTDRGSNVAINHRDNRAMPSICALSLSLFLAGCGSGDAGPSSPIALAQAETASTQSAAVSYAVTGAADEKAVTTDWTARVRDFVAKMRLEQLVGSGTTTGGTTTGGTTGTSGSATAGTATGGGASSVGGASTGTVPVTTVPGSYAPTTSGGLPANVIRIQNPTAATVSNVPLQVGRIFRKGEVPQCPQVLMNGVVVPAQVDVKNRWPDGSLKFAIVSTLTPQMTASQALTMEFKPGASCANSGNASAASLLAAFPSFDASIRLNSGGAGTASARSMLSQGYFKTWTHGPIASTVIIEDHEGKRFDFGPNPQRSLRPIFHVTFWHGTGQVNIRTIVEQSDNTKLTNLSYDAQVLLGATNPVVAYSRTAVPHNFASRWTRTFWTGGTPTQLSQNHGVGYMASTYAIPNLSSTVTLAAASKQKMLDSWAAAKKDIYDAGMLTKEMPMVGGRVDIGLFPDWVIYTLYDGDARLWNMLKSNADLAAAWPMHFREGDATRSFMKRPYVVPGNGRVMSKDGRPGVFLYDDNGYMLRASENLAADMLQPVGAIANNGWKPDNSHQPDNHYFLYVTTGEYWYLEQLQFWAGWGHFTTNPNFMPRAGMGGGIVDGLSDGAISDQTRGEAWILRTRSRAAFISPDGSPEKDYFTRTVNGAISAWLGRKIGPGDGSDPIRKNFHLYAQRYFPSSLGPNPLHFWRAEKDSDLGVADVKRISPPWQFGFMMMSLGHAQELGFNVSELKTWFSQWFVHLMTDPGSNPGHLADYFLPAQKNVAGEPYFQTWADAFDGWTNYTSSWPATVSTDLTHGYSNIMTSALSFMANEPGGAQAWAWIYADKYSRQNWSLNPKFSTLPRQ